MVSARLFLIGSMLVAIISCALNGQTPPVPEAGDRGEANAVYGAWVLVRDDDHPDGSAPYEKLVFHKDGQLLIDGVSRFCGRYAISGTQIRMAVPINGREVHYAREFTLDGTGLHLQNLTAGYAHYEREQEKLEYCAVYESWQQLVNGFFILKAPDTWTLRNRRYRGIGIQELQLVNADATKVMILIRMPHRLVRDPDIFLAQAMRKMAYQTLAKRSADAADLTLNASASLYGIDGFAYTGEFIQPFAINLEGLGKKMKNAFLFFVCFYTHDRLHEIEHVAQSVYMDGKPVWLHDSVY